MSVRVILCSSKSVLPGMSLKTSLFDRRRQASLKSAFAMSPCPSSAVAVSVSELVSVDSSGLRYDLLT